MVQIIYLFLLLMLSSCTESNDIPTPEELGTKKTITNEQSISISRFWTSDEAFLIKRFVERRGWKAIKTPTGIHYYIYKENKQGKLAKPGEIADIKFKIRLLDADTTLCYQSEQGETEPVLIEMDNVESGLHEALTYMREGEKAYIVLPHYLAHGLVGDLEKIPPLSPVLYEIELVKLIQPKK